MQPVLDDDTFPGIASLMELPSLADVLNHDVWRTALTQEERERLMVRAWQRNSRAFAHWARRADITPWRSAREARRIQDDRCRARGAPRDGGRRALQRRQLFLWQSDPHLSQAAARYALCAPVPAHPHCSLRAAFTAEEFTAAAGERSLERKQELYDLNQREAVKHHTYTYAAVLRDKRHLMGEASVQLDCARIVNKSLVRKRKKKTQTNSKAPPSSARDDSDMD